MNKPREFRVVQNILNEQEEVTSITRILKPVNKLNSCEIQIKIKAQDIKKAEQELELLLGRGDSVFFDIVKIGTQKKLPKDKP